MTAPRNDLPMIEGDSEEYWLAAGDRQLLLVRCNACSFVHHYPRPFCPQCWSEDVNSVPASGRGTLYTYSTVFVNDLQPFRERVPYLAAIVDLAEGPRVMTNIVGADPSELAIGMQVVADFLDVADGVTAVVFHPDRAANENPHAKLGDN